MVLGTDFYKEISNILNLRKSFILEILKPLSVVFLLHVENVFQPFIFIYS